MRASATIAGTDVDQARALYQEAYRGEDFRITTTDRPFRYRYRVSGDDEVSVRANLFSGAVSGSFEHPGEYVVTWITEGEGSHVAGGTESVLVHRTPKLHPVGERTSFRFRDHVQSLVHVQAPFLEAVAAEAEGHPGGQIAFDHAAVPGPGALAAWNRTLAVAAPVIVDRAATVLAREAAKRDVALALLETFSHAPVAGGPAEPAPTARVHEAADLLRARSGEPVRPSDAAAELGVPLASLAEGFRRTFDAAPDAWLQQVRLGRVRSELTEQGLEGEASLELGRRWGFYDELGFVDAYGAAFGADPRHRG
ncbi:helix-turn-helix domain-containing protein [Frigoribacterium salinisoli]